MADIQTVNFQDPQHRHDLIALMEAYALDPMGGGTALSDSVKTTLCDFLHDFPGTYSVIAIVGQQAVGIINSYTAISSFAAATIINIHDVYVLPEFRGQGIAKAMLAAIEKQAITIGACKLTLEVLSNNKSAQASYRNYGFAPYELDPQAGSAQFWQKSLKT